MININVLARPLTGQYKTLW